MDIMLRCLFLMHVWLACMRGAFAARRPMVESVSNNTVLRDGSSYFHCQPNLAVSKLNRCLPIVKKLGGKCSMDYQCEVPDVTSKCVNNRCVICPESSHAPYNNCGELSVLAAPCFTNSNCTLENSYCSRYVCRCNRDFIASSVHKDRCLPKARSIGGLCEEDVQCSGTIQTTSCRGNKCRTCGDATYLYDEYLKCTDKYSVCKYHEYDNKCWTSRDLGQECFNPEECWSHPTTNETRLCHNGKCKCNSYDGYELYEKAALGVDACMNKTQLELALKETNTSSAASTASSPSVFSSCKWSALVAMIVTTQR